MNKKFYNFNPSFYLNQWNKQNPIKKSLFNFKRSLKKALSGNYEAFLIDESFLYDRNMDFYLQQILEKKLKPIIQITIHGFKNEKQKLHQLYKKYKNSLFFNMIFEDTDKLPLKDIEFFATQMFFTYIVTKKNKKVLLKQKLSKKLFKKTEFYFPYKESFFDSFLTPSQVYKFIKKQEIVNPYKGDIYDKRIAQDMDLEPLTLPFAENKILSSQSVYFSIIIPSHNNKKQLLNTLTKLTLQNYPKDEYEIIIVDDGSIDNTKQEIKKFILQHKNFNLKAIYFPRVIERKEGDARFRAGLARNLGVKHSEGQILAFLDSDILVPPYYLQKLKKEHETADVILLKRYHLKTKAIVKDFSFDHKKLKNWHYIEEKNYWGNFYKKGFDQVQTPWKYICTYGLSLSKKDFQETGTFGKNFIFYGFEDTDLGYRLFKKNKKFLLSDIKVYHQAPSKKQQHPLFRHRQLSKTAKIFFYKHLDPQIYEEMRVYMTQKRGFLYFLPFLQKLFS